MNIEEKKKRKNKKKRKSNPQKNNIWLNIQRKRDRGERPARPGEKGYPAAKTWKKLTAENSVAERNLRALIRETITEMGIPAPLAWGRDLAPAGSPYDPYAGKEQWEIEHYEEFGEWPEVDRQDWSDEAGFDETSGGADRPLSSIR